jgi:hypothetical protein
VTGDGTITTTTSGGTTTVSCSPCTVTVGGTDYQLDSSFSFNASP